MTAVSSTTMLHTEGQRHDRIADNINGDDDADLRAALQTPLEAAGNAVNETSIVQKMLSAVTGSVLTSFAITPLDVVRVRLQTQTSPSSPSPSSARLPSFLQLPPNLGVSACCREVFWVQNHSQFCVAAPTSQSSSSSAAAHVLDEAIISDCAAAENQRRTFNSTLDGLRKIARNEGIWTLWRGLTPTLIMAVPANVIYFAGYDWLRQSPASPMYGRVSDAYAPLVAGSVARVGSALAIGPLEMLRTRMQASQSSGKGVLRETYVGMRDMVASQGYTSLWRGLSLTFWRDVPFSALYWWGYEYTRERLNTARRASSLTPERELSNTTLLTDSFLAGAASGAISALVTTPFDVGKTRQQTVMDNPDMTVEQRKALPEGKAMPRFLYHIYRNEGMSGLFKGWSARTLKVAPACAIMISSYEIGKKWAASPSNEMVQD